MIELSEKYADELSAQFRTLNFFVTHAGEIGRAHETYLRGILSRFMPAKCNVGSGFIASNDWVSFQQDVILYNQQDYPTLFEVGECVVVDKDSVAAILEVKTHLNSKAEFLQAYKKASNLYKTLRHSRFVGIFTWEGLNLDTALSAIWEYVRENPLDHFSHLPSAVYVRGKYLLTLNLDGKRESPPFRLLEIDNESETNKTAPNCVTEGQALLALIVEIWMGGLQSFANWPWWLDDWWRKLPEIEQLINWPEDLQETINASIK